MATGAQFETEGQVRDYVEATAGLDARAEISELRKLVGEGARVFELGSGGGVDLARLARHFDAIGSDPSASARRWIRRRAEAPPVVDLRAEALIGLPEVIAAAGVDPRWVQNLDAIFSSKVLHLLDPEEHRRCLAAQATLLGRRGLAMHIYWAPHPALAGHRSEPSHLEVGALRELWLEHFEEVSAVSRSELAHHDLVRITARRRNPR